MHREGSLSEKEGRQLLKLARETIEARLFGRPVSPTTDTKMPPAFGEERGTFVTLTKKGNLRGCIGHLTPQGPLIEEIRTNAINAAFRDPRFAPVRAEEWPEISLEVSILTEPKPLRYRDAQDLLQQLRPGLDGVILKKGYHQATFLPQVWDQLPRKEDFLAHLCLKAGLDQDAWRQGDLEVWTYQVQAFEEE